MVTVTESGVKVKVSVTEDTVLKLRRTFLGCDGYQATVVQKPLVIFAEQDFKSIAQYSSLNKFAPQEYRSLTWCD